MNPLNREERKLEILALAQQSLKRRRTRRRNIRITAAASAVIALGVAGEYFKQALTVAPHPEPPPIAQLPAAKIEVASQASVLAPVQVPVTITPSWVVQSKPLRKDQIVQSGTTAVVIATDAELVGDLADAGTPGIVRVKGRTFAAYELSPLEAEPVPATPPGSGPIILPTPPTAAV